MAHVCHLLIYFVRETAALPIRSFCPTRIAPARAEAFFVITESTVTLRMMLTVPADARRLYFAAFSVELAENVALVALSLFVLLRWSGNTLRYMQI